MPRHRICFDQDMALIDRPWARVRNPIPIPEKWAPADLLTLELGEFAELIRSQLLVRDQSVRGRREWERLWTELRENEQLAERSYDVLEEFLDTTQLALTQGGLEADEHSRATKFEEQCRQAWNRIDRGGRSQPLSWAGEAGKFPPSAARVIAVLVAAVARHRSAVQPSVAPTEADEELWAVLRQVNLDPADYPDS